MIRGTVIATLRCGHDVGAIAINCAGSIQGVSFIFSGILLPKAIISIDRSIYGILDYISKQRSNVAEASFVGFVNGDIVRIGNELEFEVLHHGRERVLRIYTLGICKHVGNVYVNARAVIPSIVGFADSVAKPVEGRVNEDSIIVVGFRYCSGSDVTRLVIGVVADGVSSLGQGYMASSEAIKFFVSGIAKVSYLNELLNEQLALEVFDDTSDHVHKLNKVKGIASVTTFTTFLYPINSKALVIHVGDTRLYIYRFRSREVVLVTEDHRVPGANVLTKAIGLGPVEPMHRQIDFDVGDTAVLVSDGIYTVIDMTKVVNVITRFKNVTLAINRVLSMARSTGLKDDASIAVIRALHGRG
jgi:serine/threonine protein phosphatase PrpC